MDSREGRFLKKVLDKLNLVSMFLDQIDNETTYDDLLMRKEFITECWADFKKHEDVVRTNDDISEERIKFENLYLTLMSKINRLVRAIEPKDDGDDKKPFQDFLKHQQKFLTEFSSVHNRPRDVKLPTLNIPLFDGDYYHWPTFENLFTQIHNDDRISKIQKFQYLKGLMVPNSIADECIRHFPLTANDYDEAWTKLTERFNKKRHILNSFVRKFIEQPSSSSHLSATNLRALCDTSDQIIRGLRTLGQGAESRDAFLIYLLLDKIDNETKHLWAQESNNVEFPTIAEFLNFLTTRCDALESVHGSTSSSSKSKPNQRIKTLLVTNATCPKCTQGHLLYDCSEFKSLSINDRQGFVSKRSLCFNCLKPGHGSRVCRATQSCHKCNKRHHTLIHISPISNSRIDSASGNASRASRPCTDDTPPATIKSNISNQPSTPSINSLVAVSNQKVDSMSPLESVSLHQSSSNDFTSVNMNNAINCLADNATSSSLKTSLRDSEFTCNTLIPTANVYVVDASGRRQCCRVLLDSGSHANFITESCAQRLCLQRRYARKHISGIAGSGVGYTRGYVRLQIICNSSNRYVTIDALILRSITSTLPSELFDTSSWNYIHNLSLADTQFNIPANIDILIGIEEALNVFSGNFIRGPENYPVARESIFGWVMCGKLPYNEACVNTQASTIQVSIEDALDHTLRKFWEIENIPESTMLSPEEIECEENFKANVHRDSSGRYSVRLPFKSNCGKLGNSINQAVSRLHSMEKRFARNSDLQAQYAKFMSEYLSLSHMSEIPHDQIAIDEDKAFYLPHHAVLKEESSTTKLRVVFDGSSKSSSGVSINDNLLVGESLQPKLFAILLKFRMYKIPLVADVEKMFRQVRVHEDNENNLAR